MMQHNLYLTKFMPYWKAFMALVIGLITAFLSSVFMLIPFVGKTKEPQITSAMMLMLYVVLFGLVFVIVHWRLKPRQKLLLTFNCRWNTFFRLLVIFVPLLILLGLINMVLDLPSSSADLFENLFKESQLLFFILIVVVAPILEELIFRGVILNYLLEKEIEPNRAVVFSAFLFGLIHFSPDQMLFGFLMGIFLGYTYLKANSLLMPMFFHALNNGLYFLALKYFT